MSRFSSFHTHSTFCDGHNTPEEMVLEAIRLGCPAIGFSGHSNTPFDPGYCMDEAREQAYQQCIIRLKQKYAGEIKIYLGIEQDYYSAPPEFPYEYRIGSVHYVKKGGQFLSVDDTKEKLAAGVRDLYGSDVYSLCEDYYRLVSDVVRKTECRIVGHFDLITKFNGDGSLFDESHPRYRAAALNALHSLLEQGALLEINTGAMSRGYRDAPYPAPFILEEMGKLSAEALVTSDTHSAETLLYGMEDAAALAERYHVKLREAF